MGVSGGGGVKTGWCQMLLEPQPRAFRPFHGSCEAVTVRVALARRPPARGRVTRIP